MRFTPSNSHDRECLLAVTGRVPLELAHGALIAAEGLHMVRNGEGFRPPAGCTGDCEGQRDCTCSHALAWSAPRQPRIAPRRRSRAVRVLRDLVRWVCSPWAW